MTARATAEEFYGRCLGNATLLRDAARRLADSGDAVGALATAWGADTFSVQAVVWERILVASSYPMRQYFRVAEALVASMQTALSDAHQQSTAADVLLSARAGLLEACDPALRQDVERAWPDASFLTQLPAPTRADLDASVVDRTGGLGLDAFAAQRRRDAAVAMAQAQAKRVQGDSLAAIQGAYDADLLALEGYLVESAAAVGDPYLFTAVIRWELATQAVAGLPGLPDGFLAAVARIRDTLASALGDADGQRLREVLSPV